MCVKFGHGTFNCRKAQAIMSQKEDKAKNAAGASPVNSKLFLIFVELGAKEQVKKKP